MNSINPYEEVLALKLPPKERLHLVEQVVSSVGREIEKAPSPKAQDAANKLHAAVLFSLV